MFCFLSLNFSLIFIGDGNFSLIWFNSSIGRVVGLLSIIMIIANIYGALILCQTLYMKYFISPNNPPFHYP